MANYKAHFKTALGQREKVIEATLAADLKVGQLCTFANNALAAKTSGTPVEGDYIIAQSDMTMEYGHVPVELRNYGYSPVVKASTDKKRVAVFEVIDKDDVYTSEMA